MLLIIALFSFLIWDITWITNNTFPSIMGRLIVFILGTFSISINETKN